MKLDRSRLLLYSIIFVTIIHTSCHVWGAGISIKDYDPSNYGLIESVKVILKVEVIYNNEPLPNARVSYYVDDEWAYSDFTDSNGVARGYIKNIVMPDDVGYHTWNVKVRKQGYDTYNSPSYRFNYRPRTVLKIISDFGEPSGAGNYSYGEIVNFGLESNIVDIKAGERMVFVNWVGFDEEGYSGTDLTASVNMTNNIHEYAFWKKQYYLNVSCDVPQAVSLVSGWYDENKIVGIEYIDLQGINFLGWIGSGNESYSGEDWGQNIKMLSPITQYAVIHREDFDLMVNSEYGEIWGQGSYPAYGYANFGVDNSFIYLSRNERMKFKGWSTNSDDGYTGNITEGTVLMSENTEQTANWVKQYYVQLNSTEGGNVTQASDWIDSGTILKVSTEGDQKYQFIEWIGEGDTAVNSEEKNITLFVTAPINQTAQWKKECTVLIMSALPTSGAGVYLEGDEVTLRAQTSEGLLIRRVFKKWSGGIDSTDPVFSFRITRDTSVMAEYEKNYTVFIMLVIVALMGVGVIAYRMLKS